MGTAKTRPITSAMDPEELAEMLPFATTDRQRQIIKAVISHGSTVQAAEALGVSRSTVQQALRRVRRHQNGGNHMPHIPQGHKLVGLSTLTRTEDDEPQWIKTKLDPTLEEERIKEMREAFTESLPRERAVPAPSAGNEDLINVHVLTDYHLGMKAWGEETGDDWDMKIAENLLMEWFSYSIRHAPKSDTAVLAQLGDFLHYDSLAPVTPKSGHLLDADTRFQKMVRVAIKCIRRIIRLMLKKYSKVHVIMADANHDEASSAWMREMLASFYSEDKRLIIDNSALTYYCVEHGLVSIFFHHGHKRRPQNIDHVLVSQFREVFGRTRFSYAHLGHLHHDRVLETNLMHVEQHRTMAAKDAYASHGGWLSGRSAPVITYHREFGEVGRFNVTPEMVNS